MKSSLSHFGLKPAANIKPNGKENFVMLDGHHIMPKLFPLLPPAFMC